MKVTEVLAGWKISQALNFTAFPFAIPQKQSPVVTQNTPYDWRWADFVMNPKQIIPVIFLPIIGVMIAMKGVK